MLSEAQQRDSTHKGGAGRKAKHLAPGRAQAREKNYTMGQLDHHVATADWFSRSTLPLLRL